MTRKIIVALLLLQVLLCVAMPVFAANQAEFTVLTSADQVAPGDEIVVTVKVSTSGVCTSLGFKQQVDTSVFEIVSGKCLASNASLSDFSKTEGAVVLLEKDDVFEGELCSFILRVKDDAPAGEATVGGKCAVRNGGDALACVLEEATVTVAAAQTEEQGTTTATSAPTVPAETDNAEQIATQPEEESLPTKPEEEEIAKDDETAPEDGETPEDVLTIGPSYEEPEEKFPAWTVVIIGLVVAVMIAVIVIKRR